MNIWNRAKADWVVIPTNGGWRLGPAGVEGILGAGLALQAAKRYPPFVSFVGCHNQALCWDRPGLYVPGRLIAVATKPVDLRNPPFSWKQPANLGLVEQQCALLSVLIPTIEGRIWLPALGCGLGGLSIEAVTPVVDKWLGALVNSGKVVLTWKD